MSGGRRAPPQTTSFETTPIKVRIEQGHQRIKVTSNRSVICSLDRLCINHAEILLSAREAFPGQSVSEAAKAPLGQPAGGTAGAVPKSVLDEPERFRPAAALPAGGKVAADLCVGPGWQLTIEVGLDGPTQAQVGQQLTHRSGNPAKSQPIPVSMECQGRGPGS